MKKNDGVLFIFEGVDKVGKSTIVSEVCKQLEREKVGYSNYSFPGKEEHTLGAFVYDLHHNVHKYSKRDINPISLQLLHVASHIDILKNSIIPDLNSGKIVLLDRSWWSTYAYGKAMGIGKRTLQNIIASELELVKKMKKHIFLIKRDHVSAKEALKMAYKEVEKSMGTQGILEVIENNGEINSVVSLVLKKILSTKEKQDTNISTNKKKASKYSASIIQSEIYDEYWKFAAKRQAVFFNRFYDKPFPWTDDRIIEKYKFTNAYRASDRVSQYLIRNVIYNDKPYSSEDMLFRILLFKLFNKIDTWRHLEKAVGDIRYNGFSFDKYDVVLSDLLKKKEKIYSGAYIMPSGKNAFGYDRKHRNQLMLLEHMMEDCISQKVAKAKSLKELYELLLQYPTFGKFLAFQMSIDINYSELCDFDEMSFVVAGPGARSGIEKCFKSTGNYTEEDIIRIMAEKQQQEFERLHLDFKDLWGRPLQLIDCQNLFCETDKYSRVAFPAYEGHFGRSRIKQLYSFENKEKISYFYPPKWGINSRIKGGSRN